MSIANRLERLEARAGLRDCPCRAPRLIESVEVDAADVSDGPPVTQGCGRCARPLPISRIVAVRPPAETGLAPPN